MLLIPMAESSWRWMGRPEFFFSRKGFMAGMRKREKKPFFACSASSSPAQSYVQLTRGGGVLGSPLAAAAAFARLSLND